MTIPSNLLPINTTIQDSGESASTSITQQVSTFGVLNNLLPVNASEISASFQSLAGQLPTELAIEIPQYSLLNQAVPDTMFLSGSLDKIRDTTTKTAQQAVNTLKVAKPTFSVPGSIPTFSPKLPSFGQIKNFINTKIDRIKRHRQQASIRALKDELKQRESPFTHRQFLANQAQKNAVLDKVNNNRG